MQTTDKMREYWQKNLRITGVLLVIWFLVSFGIVFFAKELSTLTFFGFPFSFYMGAQGSLIIFVAIIAYYARTMNKMDKDYGVSEEE